ncbi:MAG TPA: ABC transporter permease [Patescibacteria group bacterium]|nr:ABC transporter permease [Patescibacteria group bacterium]
MIFRHIVTHFIAGFETLRSSKLRSFWTMLGIIIGVSSVITIVAIGEGIKQQIGGQIHHYGSNVITVRSAELSIGSGSSINNISTLSGLSVSGPLSGVDLKTVSNANGVNASAPLTLVSGQINGDSGQYKNGFVIGTYPTLPNLLNQSLAYGSFLSSNDSGTNVAVLGPKASQSLFNEDVPLGRSFKFRGHYFIVEGIFNQFTSTPLSQQADFNNAVFIPYDVAQSLTNKTAPTYEILAQPTKGSQINQVASNIRSALNSTHGGQSGFTILTGSQNLAVNNNILDLLTKLIAGVAAISLLVAGIGIMNVMLVSVSERIREIGIRKAVGATNRQILGQFLVEATLLSLAGGFFGILLAYFFDYSVRIATDFKPIISWQIVVLASSISLLVGVIFGSIPAMKAAAKDPIEALRAE